MKLPNLQRIFHQIIEIENVENNFDNNAKIGNDFLILPNFLVWQISKIYRLYQYEKIYKFNKIREENNEINTFSDVIIFFCTFPMLNTTYLQKDEDA